MAVIRKDVKGFKNAWLLNTKGGYFILAAGENSHKGETIAFKSDKNGSIKDWKKESVFVNIGLDEAAKMLSQQFEVKP